MFDHRVVGDNVTVIKSPYYYDQKNVYLDKIVFKPMPDAAAAAAALKAGDIQVLDRVSTTELAGVQQTSSLRVIQAPQLGWQGIVINIGNRTASATCRTRTWARRSPRARSCGRRSRRRSTATR